jgi:hypothetical protein
MVTAIDNTPEVMERKRHRFELQEVLTECRQFDHDEYGRSVTFARDEPGPLYDASLSALGPQPVGGEGPLSKR